MGVCCWLLSLEFSIFDLGIYLCVLVLISVVHAAIDVVDRKGRRYLHRFYFRALAASTATT